MNNIRYILIYGCNGVKNTIQFNDLYSAYEYIVIHKIDRMHLELFKAERLINEDV